MRALVTGGAGFIGSHLVDSLLAGGCSVRVLDNLSTGKISNLPADLPVAQLDIRVGSVTDTSLVAECVRDCEIVYHLAAAIGVRYVIDDPLTGIATNVRGTEVVLDAACATGARVVVASSSEVYGKGRAGTAWMPFREDADSIIGPTTTPRWWYAIAKALDEHLAFAYYRHRGLPTSAVRYFNIYGPRCDPGGYGVLARFISQALRDEPLTIFGDGLQTRSFTYVSDAVRATLAAGSTAGALGEAFNVGSPHEISIGDLARMVVDLTSSQSVLQYQEHAEVFGANFEDTRRRVPDIVKADRVLGFHAVTGLSQGISQTAAWWTERMTRENGAIV